MPSDFGVPCRSNGDGRAGELNFAAVGGEDAGKEFHEGRLAGAVVAEQAEHFSFAQIEAHVLDRMDAAKSLDDVAKLDDGRHVIRALR